MRVSPNCLAGNREGTKPYALGQRAYPQAAQGRLYATGHRYAVAARYGSRYARHA